MVSGRSVPLNLTPVPSVTLNDIAVFDGCLVDAASACVDLALSRTGGRIATANLDFFAQARHNRALRRDLQASTLVVADGMPVVWLSRIRGAQNTERIAGVDLVREICALGGSTGTFRVAIYGSTAEIAASAARYLRDLASGVNVVAIVTPPFRQLTPEESDEHRSQLAAAEPHLVLVALGCPAQERLIAEWSPHIPSAVWIGIGGTLDFFSGKRTRAPKWVQRFGMEWLARMVQEPRRLGKRYLIRDLPTLAILTVSCVRDRFAGEPVRP